MAMIPVRLEIKNNNVEENGHVSSEILSCWKWRYESGKFCEWEKAII